ncbi:hypothetical protein OK884_11050, partial [Streptococcus pneumoniae]|nr:hypothetical protein [Streptococcus pneumoniae]
SQDDARAERRAQTRHLQAVVLLQSMPFLFSMGPCGRYFLKPERCTPAWMGRQSKRIRSISNRHNLKHR